MLKIYTHLPNFTFSGSKNVKTLDRFTRKLQNLTQALLVMLVTFRKSVWQILWVLHGVWQAQVGFALSGEGFGEFFYCVIQGLLGAGGGCR